MVFSKSFGYALRGILYTHANSKKNKKIPLDEIATHLMAPRYFLAKVMMAIVKQGILNSERGLNGGFYSNDTTLQTPLSKLAVITGEKQVPGTCVLQLGKCNAKNPCPMHDKIFSINKNWYDLLAHTTIGDLVKQEQYD